MMEGIDGVPGFNSSSTFFWPIQFTINEFPPWLRKKYILLGALWYGSGKPKLEAYYWQVVCELQSLSTTGFKWLRGMKTVISTVDLLLVSVDSPARCMGQNFTQFNSYNGCSWCEINRTRVKKGNGEVTVFPFNNGLRLCTKTRVNRKAEWAVENGVPIAGVKRFLSIKTT